MNRKDNTTNYHFGNMPKEGQTYYVPNFAEDWAICRKWNQDNPRIDWEYWFKGLVCKTCKEAHDLKREMLEVARRWRENKPHKKFNNKQSW